jgi:hypothetical protein
MPTAEQQLASYIGKFDPANQKLIRSVRAAMRKRLPTAHELVYDNYNFFVIGYSPTERPSDAIFSIAAAAKGVSICFLHGARLPDPDKLLSGGGKQVRFLRLPNAKVLSQPEVTRLMTSAIERASTELPESGRGKLIIRSVSAKQRPRRQPAK